MANDPMPMRIKDVFAGRDGRDLRMIIPTHHIFQHVVGVNHVNQFYQYILVATHYRQGNRPRYRNCHVGRVLFRVRGDFEGW